MRRRASISAKPRSQWPIRVSANGRYFVDNFGRPFLLQAISCQGGIIESPADFQLFVSTYASLGFNAVQFDVVTTSYVTQGGVPFNSAYVTRDGIYAFTNHAAFPDPFDPVNSPTAAYWARVDLFVRLCAQYGLLAILNPASQLGDLPSGTGALAYGKFIGKRYSKFLNVAYQYGNDYTVGTNDATDAQMMLGIQQSALPGTLTMQELDAPPDSTGFDDANFTPYLNVQGTYTYNSPILEAITSYNNSGVSFGGKTGTNKIPPCPSVLIEANYEWESLNNAPGNPLTMRLQMYWILLSGQAGQIYGNGFVSTSLATVAGGNILVAGYNAGGWKNNMATTGVAHMKIGQAFFNSIPWQNLVPDQTHVIGTAGYGTIPSAGTGFDQYSYVPVAATADGKYAVAYFIYGKAGTLTIDMTKFVGPINAEWFDPTDGAYSTIAGSPFNNTGTHAFVPTGNNSIGDPDWILLLTSAVATGLPAGVTLQAIDGETMITSTTMSNSYYSSNGFTYATNPAFTVGTAIWSAGLSWDDPTFYPLGCFYGLYTDVMTQFLDLGYNVSICSTSDSDMATISGAGIWTMVGDSGTENTPNVCSMAFHIDEPGTLAELTSAFSTANALQDGRSWDLTYTHNGFRGGDIGGTNLSVLLSPNYFTTPNGTKKGFGSYSIDLYWFAGSSSYSASDGAYWSVSQGSCIGYVPTTDQMARGSNYGNMIDFMRAQSNGQFNMGGIADLPDQSSLAPSKLIIFSLPENTNGLLGDTGVRNITAPEYNWAVWSSIIHGARGMDTFTVAFDHNGALGAGAVYNQIKATNTLIQQIAPVINSPFAKGFVSAVSPHGYIFPVYEGNWMNGGIECCVHWYQGGNVSNRGLALVNGFYIFATTRNSESVTNTVATFTVAAGSLVTVVGESRTINIGVAGGFAPGTFQDNFANAWTVHIYQIS